MILYDTIFFDTRLYYDDENAWTTRHFTGWLIFPLAQGNRKSGWRSGSTVTGWE